MVSLTLLKQKIFKKKIHGKKVLPFIAFGFNSDIDNIEDVKKVSMFIKKQINLILIIN